MKIIVKIHVHKISFKFGVEIAMGLGAFDIAHID